jgi:hypothetical protein
MNLKQVISAIERVAAGQPSVGTIVRNDIYRLNTAPSVRYGVFAWLQGEHRTEPNSGLMYYTFTFFYADRLTADRQNENEVQSVGIETLDNIVRSLANAEIWAESVTFNTFNERFSDECAGVWCNVTFEVRKDGVCPAEYEFLVNEGDYDLDFNEDFKVWVWHTKERDIFII